MSAFGGLIFTNKGRNLQAKAQAGAQLNFTRIAVGDGDLGGSSIADLNALINQVKTISITKLSVLVGGKAVVGASFSNQDLLVGFYWKELGVFAQDPDLGEILYCYGNSGVNAEYIPAGGGPDIVEKTVDVVTIVGNAASVTATIEESLIYYAQDDVLTVDQTQVPATPGNGKISQLFNWLANRIIAITGKPNWWDVPDTTLATTKTHIDAAAPHTGHETPAGAQAKANAVQSNLTMHEADDAAHDAVSSAIANKIIRRDAAGGAKVAAPSAADDIARKDTVDAVQTNLTAHAVAAAPHSGHIAHSLATAANDFLIASGAGTFVKKTLAEVKSILGLGSAAYTASTAYATAAQGTLATNAIPQAAIVAVSASKTLALTDAWDVQNCTNAAAITITIPTNATVAFAVGTEIAFMRSGAGTVAIAPASGVTLTSKDAKRSIDGQYASCALKKIATDTWVLVGALTT